MRRIWQGILLGGAMMLVAAGLAKAANTPDQGHSSLSASSSVPADGQTQVTITVTLNDSTTSPVVGDSVTLTDPNNSSASINTTSGTTNSSGQATFTMTSTQSGTDSLNVTDTTANVTFSGLGTVTFDVPPVPTQTPPGYCGDAVPGTPALTDATAISSTKIKLTWTDAADPVSYYLVSYGIAAGKYIYGNPNVGGQGTTSYTVGSLVPGKTYYFAVKAVNGCAAGSFSNEMSAGATGSVTQITAVPTRMPTIGIPTAAPIPTAAIIVNTIAPELMTEPQPTPTSTPISTSFVAGLDSKQVGLMLVLVFAGAGLGTVIWNKYSK